MAEAHSLRGVVQEIREDERERERALRSARFAPKIVPDPCLDSPNGAHHWKYRTSGAASRRVCNYCQEKR